MHSITASSRIVRFNEESVKADFLASSAASREISLKT